MPDWEMWLHSGGELAIAIAVGFILDGLLFRILSTAYRHNENPIPWIPKIRGPVRWATIFIAVLIALPATHLSPALHNVIEQLLSLGLIAMVGWTLIALTNVYEAIIFRRYDIAVKDNLLARKLRTRVTVLRKIAMAMIVIITLSAMLMSFPAVRALGASLLASAGMVGLVSGLAARPVLTNLIAGLQLALTQPIRIEDVVIVNGEWGWIEEINVAYVVVRIWDLRRLILPLSYFIEQPFQNWTYNSSDLLGYVHLYTDYTVNVDAIRQQLLAILNTTSLWDGKSWSLQVTETDEHGVQLRALFSTCDSNARWALMVYVRERLLAFIREQYPDYFPRTRVIFPGEPDRTALKT